MRADAAQYIGNWYKKQGDNGTWSKVQLVDVQIYDEMTTAWSPVTFGHLSFYVNGMLSMLGATEGLINIFAVDADTLQIDEVAFLADIALYGVFEYADFEEMIPEVFFDAFQIKYLTVSLGKGLITWERVEELVGVYSKFFDDVEQPEEQEPTCPGNNGNGKGGVGKGQGRNNGNGKAGKGHNNGNGK